MAELNDPDFHALKVRAKIHAMGATYLCHPSNRVQRINRAPVAVPGRPRIHDGYSDSFVDQLIETRDMWQQVRSRIADRMIADALGLFRAPGFNGRRYQK